MHERVNHNHGKMFIDHDFDLKTFAQLIKHKLSITTQQEKNQYIKQTQV